MSTFKNFVQCRVTSPISSAADSIGLYAAVPPYSLPSEEGGLLVLTDSPTKPSKLEVISYTSRSALGLYGVSRGLEGTTAIEWTGPVYCYQSLLAGEFKTLLDSKVDKVAGKGLSDTNFTQAEKNKLSSLEGSKFVGLFVSESALPLSGSEGDYANVDGGVDSDVYRVIWDSSDGKWVKMQGVSTDLTPAQIKQQYESNPDTNAFTDSQKTKLTGVATGATKNRADTLNADKTHPHTTAQITGLDTVLGNKVDKTNIVQVTGTSTTSVMSQKAVTDAINNSTVGVGQTRQDVSANRAWGTNYTNTTGKPIKVFISSYANTAGANVGLFVDGDLADAYILGKGNGVLMSAEVPAGSDYSSGSDPAGAVTLIAWDEMR